MNMLLRHGEDEVCSTDTNRYRCSVMAQVQQETAAERAFLVLAKFCGPVTVAKSEKGFAKPRLLAGQKYMTLHGSMMSQA